MQQFCKAKGKIILKSKGSWKLWFSSGNFEQTKRGRKEPGMVKNEKDSSGLQNLAGQ